MITQEMCIEKRTSTQKNKKRHKAQTSKTLVTDLNLLPSFRKKKEGENWRAN